MGRSTTPQYVIRTTDTGYVGNTPGVWKSKYYGKPTAANLAAYVATFNASLLPGGCNAHIGPEGALTEAYIIDQYNDDKVVAVWNKEG